MHDQKLTEENLPINHHGFTGFENISEMMQEMERVRMSVEHFEKYRFIGGTGSESKGDNGRWMYDDDNYPGLIKPRMKPEWFSFLDRTRTSRIPPKPIDHPYLLPPASGRTAWRNKSGELVITNAEYIDCRRDGVFVSSHWNDRTFKLTSNGGTAVFYEE